MNGFTRARGFVWPTLWLAALAAAEEPATGDPAELFRDVLSRRAVEVLATETAVARGSDGFYFLGAELRGYAQPVFWGEHAAAACAACARGDPLPAILDCHEQLKKAGVRLIFLPVPGKVAVYPDKLDPALAPPETRLDRAHQAFYRELQSNGLEVVDIADAFLQMRRGGTATHCRQDTHWSPQALEYAARTVAALIRKEPWIADYPTRAAERQDQTVSIRGDLVNMLKDEQAAEESLAIRTVRLGGARPASDPQSPVVVMGDSHALVYNQPIPGGIAAHGAGFSDHLAAELGFAPDLVAMMGGGANGPRLTLARRRDNLAGKRCVVWLFTARELTESPNGWQKIPIIR